MTKKRRNPVSSTQPLRVEQNADGSYSWIGRKPTKKQLAFIDVYVRTDNKIEAYRAAYPGSKMNNANIARAAARMLKAPVVLRAIEICRAVGRDKIIHQHERKTQSVADAVTKLLPAPYEMQIIERYVAAKERLAELLTFMAESDIRDYVQWDAAGNVTFTASDKLTPAQARAILKFRTTPAKGGGSIINLELESRRGAIMDLARLMGMLVEPTDDLPTEDQELIAKRAETKRAFLAYLKDMAKPAALTIEERIATANRPEGLGPLSGGQNPGGIPQPPSGPQRK